jgi:hypothetical protein
MTTQDMQLNYMINNLRDFLRVCADDERWRSTLERLNETIEADGVMPFIYPEA